MPNKYGDIGGTLAARLEKKALEHAKPMAVVELGAKKLSHPKNGTKTTKHRRVIPYSPATTPLSEGVPPAATAIQYEELELTVQQYGGYTEITDVVVDLHTTPVLKDINEQNAEQVVRTREALLWSRLRATPSVIYSGGVSAIGSVTAPLSYSLQAKATRVLKRNKAKKFTQIVQGGVKQATQPIEAAYLCFVHTDAEDAIRAMDGFTPVAKYGSQKPVSPNEFGAVGDVRYISSPDLEPQIDAGATGGSNLSTGGSKADVYSAVYVGMNAYAIVQLAGQGSIIPVVRNVGTPSKSDPLGQVGSVGWKMYTAEGVINTDWIVVVKFAVAE